MLLIKRVCHTENTRETKFSCPTYAQSFFFFFFFWGGVAWGSWVVFLGFKESRVLPEYETHYLLQHSLGNSHKMLTQLARAPTGSPDWFTCAPSSHVFVSLWSRVQEVRARPELGSFRVELTLGSFRMCHFTISFQKAEFFKLAGIRELNSFNQGLWIRWGHVGLPYGLEPLISFSNLSMREGPTEWR